MTIESYFGPDRFTQLPKKSAGDLAEIALNTENDAIFWFLVGMVADKVPEPLNTALATAAYSIDRPDRGVAIGVLRLITATQR